MQGDRAHRSPARSAAFKVDTTALKREAGGATERVAEHLAACQVLVRHVPLQRWHVDKNGLSHRILKAAGVALACASFGSGMNSEGTCAAWPTSLSSLLPAPMSRLCSSPQSSLKS